MFDGANNNYWPSLLLGEGITLLGAARSLAAAGIESVLLANRGDFASWSRYASRISVPAGNGFSDLARLLDTIPIEQAVLMPCTDEGLSAAVALPDNLRERFPASLPPAHAVRAYTDKALFAEALRTFEIPHPRTIAAIDRETTEQFSEADIGDFFLKPCDSQAFARYYRTKAVSVSSKADAAAKVERFGRDGFAVVFQEMIPGPVTNQYHVDGLVDRFGRVAAAMARQRIRMYPTDFGNSTMLVSVPMETLAMTVEPLNRLLRGLEHRGIFSAEFKWDDRDGNFKLLEINARPWWQVEFSTLCGVNLCAMAYRDALADDVPTISTYEVGRRFRILAHDARAFRDMRKAGETNLVDWLASLRGTTDAINRLTDPLPALGFAREIAGKQIARSFGG